MRLLEFEGKALFARHGIPVPRGALWPELPQGVAGYAVKAQTRGGGRGKQGGIRFAATAGEAALHAEALSGAQIGGNPVERVYVEERLDIARELYLAVVLDRDRRCHSLLASPDGGVEVEAADRLLRLPIDPLAGLRDDEVRRVTDFLDLPEAAGALVRALYEMAVAGDTVLAEINPLVVTADGALVAADARVALDPGAAFRHGEWDDLLPSPEGTEAERKIAAAGPVGVEIDPDGHIVGVVSGAGLMMATLDAIVDGGGKPRLMVDLGGIVLGGPDGVVPVFEAVGSLAPRVTLINAYMHTALCDDFARALAEAYRRAPFAGRVVMRLKGRRDVEARDILAPLGFDMYADFEPALDAALELARGEG